MDVGHLLYQSVITKTFKSYATGNALMSDNRFLREQVRKICRGLKYMKRLVDVNYIRKRFYSYEERGKYRFKHKRRMMRRRYLRVRILNPLKSYRLDKIYKKNHFSTILLQERKLAKNDFKLKRRGVILKVERKFDKKYRLNTRRKINRRTRFIF